MANYQMPIDGKLGKTWKVSSYMGMRIHPVTGKKKHHNGTDAFGLGAGPWYIEAIADSKVLYAGPSKLKKENGEPDGFGYYVVLLHKINGEWYTSLYGHMVKGSLKVKTGQKIEAGTVLGKMGTTGMSTGVHLHWELRKGKQHIWDANGKNYVEPIKFMSAAIKLQAIAATAADVATENDPVAPAPNHTEAEADALEAKRLEEKAAAKVAVLEKPKVAEKPQDASEKTYKVKPGDSYWGIASAHPVDGKLIADCVKRLQDLNNNKPLHPGDIIKLY